MEYNLQLLISLSIILIYFLSKRFKPLYMIPITYILLSGLIASWFPVIFNPYLDSNSLFAISNFAVRSVLLFSLVLLIPKTKSIFIFFSHLAVLNSVYMLLRFSLGIPMYGLGLAPSFDTTLLAILYPSVVVHSKTIKIKYLRFIYLSIPILAIILAKGSVGVGGVCLALSIMFLYGKFSMRSALYMLIPIGIFSIAYLHDGQLFYENARVVCWKWSMEFWWTHMNHWVGSGLGTFSLIGPYIQLVTNNQPTNFYVFMHNDWLQCLFELGYIGTCLVLSAVLYAVYRSRKNSFLLASIITYSACALMYYPTKNIITAVYGIILLKSAFDMDHD